VLREVRFEGCLFVGVEYLGPRFGEAGCAGDKRLAVLIEERINPSLIGCSSPVGLCRTAKKLLYSSTSKSRFIRVSFLSNKRVSARLAPHPFGASRRQVA
jgi:hypothetical protein